jgi:hypothetical protein
MAETKLEEALSRLCQLTDSNILIGQNVAIGDRSVSLQSNSKEVLDSLLSLLGHLETISPATHILRVSILQDKIRLPHVGPQGFLGEKISAYIDQPSASIVIANEIEKITYVIARQNPFSFDRPDRARGVLQALASSQLVPIHGATVAWPDCTGILISAPGGSGKSSALAASILVGALTTGDDFQLVGEVEKDGTFSCWSLFRSLRIVEGGLASELLGQTSYLPFEGKLIYDLAAVAQGSLVKRLQIAKIVVPKFCDHNYLNPLDKLSAARAIAPSSIGLAVNKVRSLDFLLSLIDQIPTFEMGFTPDLSANAHYLRKIGTR